MRSSARTILLIVALPLASCEDYVQYQLQTQTNPPPARALGSAVLQHTVGTTAALGRYMWLFGGLTSTLGALNDLWRLDLQTKVWVSQAPFGTAPQARSGASMVINSRSAYLFGGASTGNSVLSDLFMLHLGGGATTTPTWETITSNVTGTPPSARTEHSASTCDLLNIGGAPKGMLLFGGVDGTGTALADLHSLQLDTLTWRQVSPTGTLPQARKGHKSVLLLNSLLAIYGGSNPQVPVHYSDVHILDIARNVWIQPSAVSSSNQPVGRDGHSMVAIGDTVYIFGGVSARGEKLSDLWSFNAYAAASGQLRWSQPVGMSTIPAARWGHVGLGYSGDSMAILGGAGPADAFLADMHVISTGCSGELTLASARGVFSDGDGKYRNNLDCRWVLAPTLPNTYVRVVITQLELLDSGDKLEVYDGDKLTDTLMATYTGSSIPPSLISNRPKMLVRLVTDAAGETGLGFQAAYQAVCAVGYTWDAVSAQCAPCPAGSYANLPASSTCQACPLGFFAPLPGATSCLQCPAYSTTSQPGAYLIQACACQPGYYGWNNECRVCAEGASCPGGNIVAARAGWCETTNATTSLPTFSHCCEPTLCPGGINARCDASVGLVGQASCQVRMISWDTLGLVSLTTGTWVTFVLIVILFMLICFCTGLSLGVRRAVRRQLDSLVVPVPASPPKNKGAANPRPISAPTFTPVEQLGANGDVSVDGPMHDPAGAAPQAPVRTPDGDPAAYPQHPHAFGHQQQQQQQQQQQYGSQYGSQRMLSSANLMPSHPHPLLAGRSSGGLMAGAERGPAAAEEDVLVVSLDDAAMLGAAAPPPRLHKPEPQSGGGGEPTPRQATPAASARGGDDESVAATEDEGAKRKSKGKKSKKEEPEEEDEEEPAADEDEGKRRKGKGGKDGDNKKKKKSKGEEEGGEEEEEPKKEKKKKKGKGE